MQPDQPVYSTPVDRILAFMRDTFGPQFVSYYDGDPILIGESSLPAVCVLLDTENVEVENSMQDMDSQSITIKLVLNKKDDYGASDNVDLTEKRLRLLVGARDKTTGQWLPETLMGALRQNLTLSQTVVDQKIKVTYKPISRPLGPDQYLVTQEAWIVLSDLDSLVTVLNRT